ncbi:MAG: hypothetical protein AAF602_33635 [Myxococcota bacterium]
MSVHYVSKVRVVRHRGTDRTASMPGGEEVPFGVHGSIAEHYGVSMEGRPVHSATIDYVVAAVAG